MPEQEALEITYQAIQRCCWGRYGPERFQAANPAAMIQSIRKVVHEKFTGTEAFEFSVIFLPASQFKAVLGDVSSNTAFLSLI